MYTFIILLITSAHLRVEGGSFLTSDENLSRSAGSRLRKTSQLGEIIRKQVVDKHSSAEEQETAGILEVNNSWSAGLLLESSPNHSDLPSGQVITVNVKNTMRSYKDNVEIYCCGVKDDNVITDYYTSKWVSPQSEYTWSLLVTESSDSATKLVCTFKWTNRLTILFALYTKDTEIDSKWQVDEKGLFYNSVTLGLRFMREWGFGKA